MSVFHVSKGEKQKLLNQMYFVIYNKYKNMFSLTFILVFQLSTGLKTVQKAPSLFSFGSSGKVRLLAPVGEE